jgi:hypothetical protein
MGKENRSRRNDAFQDSCKREKAQEDQRAMTPAMPRESRASEAMRSDEVSAGARAKIRRIANRTPKKAVLIASISAGSPSHMICLTLKGNQFSHRPPVISSFGSAD